MSDFFPDMEEDAIEKEDHVTEDIPIALYVCPKGYVIHEDMDMINYVAQEHGDIAAEKVTDLLAKNQPGSYVKLDSMALVTIIKVYDD
jgi:hypothetical protein